jgi:hypothetical protein
MSRTSIKEPGALRWYTSRSPTAASTSITAPRSIPPQRRCLSPRPTPRLRRNRTRAMSWAASGMSTAESSPCALRSFPPTGKMSRSWTRLTRRSMGWRVTSASMAPRRLSRAMSPTAGRDSPATRSCIARSCRRITTLFPSESLHNVRPVTRGARVCSFFWIQSMVREDSVRTILFDLDNVAQSVGAGDPNSPNAVKLISIYHNLLRRWAEV